VDWSVVAAIGEVAGAAGVVLSLLYLGRQIRASSLADKRLRYEQALAESTAWGRSLAGEGELAAIMLRGLTDGRSVLTPVERFRFNASVIQIFRAYESICVYADEGGMPEWGKKDFDEFFRDFIGLTGVQEYWAERQHWFAPAMRVQVDQLAGQPGDTLRANYAQVSHR